MSKRLETLVCKNCGEYAFSLVCMAMLCDLGARAYPSPTHCTEETKHEFVDKSELIFKKILKKELVCDCDCHIMSNEVCDKCGDECQAMALR